MARYLHGVFWAYRNVPHEATGEKPSYLLFSTDCRSPTDAAFFPCDPRQSVEVGDYRLELTTRKLYDRKTKPLTYKL